MSYDDDDLSNTFQQVFINRNAKKTMLQSKTYYPGYVRNQNVSSTHKRKAQKTYKAQGLNTSQGSTNESWRRSNGKYPFNNEESAKGRTRWNAGNKQVWTSCETTDEHIHEMKTMSIFPTEQDLFDKSPELEKNIVEGAYRNVDHYLAVQFRLLREDFMGSLRNGITDYRRHNSSKDDTEVSIYTDVKVLGSSFIGGGKFGHKIKFNNSINWVDFSKDCKFGSLLLLTTNKFETFFSATVVDMDCENHTLMVKFNTKHNIVNVCACQFTVAVSKVYFEPYFHVLNGLQKMAQETFPMEKYIIKVNPRPKPPAYIKELNLRTYKINGNHYVDVLSTSWPHLESMKLNPSQHCAFQAALTNEFVAIQGPPGTGKTFLARQIVSALLDNVKIDTPILVVCYKNQALDQFLEGILEKTKNIIRIGSKSQSEVLEKFNIKNHRPKNYGYNVYAKPMERLAAEYSTKEKLLNETILRDDKRSIKEEMREIERKIQVLEQQLDDARNTADLGVMKKTKVVGMTTSGAARLRPWLNQLGAKIVVIEEAAEVLESHIVTALSSQCQHVILLGDHKQLRPSTEVYELCQKYNLDISLFERMVENGLNCFRLNVQHRMRPEFSSLIAPTIYNDLTNHKSTENRQNIPGVSKNLFFIKHYFNEHQLPNSVSFRNEHESSFVVQLARYLIKQGTQQEDITILATYSDQVRLISKMMKQYPETMTVNVSTVDDFQGQESKIIILSLVRSNKKRKVGFLKMENRVCVALSRARDGFYIIGNMKLLALNTKIWCEVERSLLKLNAIGDCMSLHCQYHPKIITLVSKGEEIAEIVERGCNSICGYLLRCGHTCKYRCHTNDRAHVQEYKCTKVCEYKLNCGHTCKYRCHTHDRAHVQEYKCTKVCEYKLNCGHACKYRCHTYDQAHVEEYKCTEVCGYKLNCGHTCKFQCHTCDQAHVQEYKCTEVCGYKLNCGHTCKNRCHTHDQAYVEEYKCTEVCGYKLNCGHTYMYRCHTYDLAHVEEYKCPVMCERTLTRDENSSILRRVCVRVFRTVRRGIVSAGKWFGTLLAHWKIWYLDG